jgi:hypothetical protein
VPVRLSPPIPPFAAFAGLPGPWVPTRYRDNPVNGATCARPSCSAGAVAWLTYDYGHQRAWLADEAGEGDHWPLCARHADNFKVPQGWALFDLRAPAVPLPTLPGLGTPAPSGDGAEASPAVVVSAGAPGDYEAQAVGFEGLRRPRSSRSSRHSGIL